MSRRETQHPINQLETQPPEEPLPQPALHRVDQELQEAVESDQSQKREAQREKIGQPLHGDTLEEAPCAAKPSLQNGWHIQTHLQERLGRARGLEALALDGSVDNQLWQGQREKIEGLRQERDAEDHELVATRMLPDVLVKRLMLGHADFQIFSANA